MSPIKACLAGMCGRKVSPLNHFKKRIYKAVSNIKLELMFYWHKETAKHTTNLHKN
jgi:hypothetical protein